MSVQKSLNFYKSAIITQTSAIKKSPNGEQIWNLIKSTIMCSKLFTENLL